MSLVQHINRKRPRTFHNSKSGTSSPGTSVTPNNKTSNPFYKAGYSANDPILLNSDDESSSDLFSSSTVLVPAAFQISYERNQGHANGMSDSITSLGNYFDLHNSGQNKLADYESDGSVVVVEKWHESDKENPFELEILPDSRNQSVCTKTAYHSDSSSVDSAIFKVDPKANSKVNPKRVWDQNPNSSSETCSEEDGSFAFKKQRANSISPNFYPLIPQCLENYTPIRITKSMLKEIVVPKLQDHDFQNCWDEENGHYKVNIGSYYGNGRFKVLKLLGQGTFGRVIQCYDSQNDCHVAIKVIKAVSKYREAAKVELRVLKTLEEFDKEDKYGCIHYREVFDYKNHISIVTDLMSLSVYDFHGTNNYKSFPGSHIQSFAKQFLKSVVFLHDLNIVHTDLKPENTLLVSSEFFERFYYEINQSALSHSQKERVSGISRSNYNPQGMRKMLNNTKMKLIDFGSAIFDSEYHAELVSTRHYRAPEISFGIGWSYECDIWSIGCVLVELLIGEPLFNTHDNREHLLMMEKVTNERLDATLVESCCVDNLEDLNRLRLLRRPYESFGSHLKHQKHLSFNDSSETFHGNGYGAIPSRISQFNMNDEIYEFLSDRGESYVKIDKQRSFYSTPFDAVEKDPKFELSLKKAKLKRPIVYNQTGLKKIKQKFPPNVSSSVKKNVNNLKPLEHLVCDKIGVSIDTTMPVEESYFKYCLDFSDAVTDKKLLLSVTNPNFIDGTSSLSSSLLVNEDFESIRNLNSVCGGCMNSDWVKLSERFSDHYKFFRDLRVKIESCKKTENANISNDLDNLIVEAIATRRKKFSNKSFNLKGMRKLVAKYPAERLEEYPIQTHLDNKVVRSVRMSGPIDYDTFKFWYNFIDLLKGLLVLNPYKRLTGYEALNHKWFSSGIYDDGTIFDFS